MAKQPKTASQKYIWKMRCCRTCQLLTFVSSPVLQFVLPFLCHFSNLIFMYIAFFCAARRLQHKTEQDNRVPFGMVQANMGQKLLKRNKIKSFN
jgi:hypothetical protein